VPTLSPARSLRDRFAEAYARASWTRMPSRAAPGPGGSPADRALH
jgi:hypothetical protein